MKCDVCETPLRETGYERHGHEHNATRCAELSAERAKELQEIDTIRRVHIGMLEAQLEIAREALERIRDAEMSPHPPHTVDAGVRLIAADALDALGTPERKT